MTRAIASLTLAGMNNTESPADAIARFIAERGVTRCPAACVTRTTASIPATDRAKLAKHAAEAEAARLAKIARFRNSIGVA